MTELNDFVVAGLGIATVFTALICIIFLCNVMGAIFSRVTVKPDEKGGRNGETKAPSEPAAGEAPSVQASAVSVPETRYVKAKLKDRGAFIAAVSAVIAEDLGCDVSRIRIHSVRQRADAIENRGAVCAAVSAVIALETGCDAVRIHSIRRKENRGELCAAISSVIALDTGADAVRIHSIKRV